MKTGMTFGETLFVGSMLILTALGICYLADRIEKLEHRLETVDQLWIQSNVQNIRLEKLERKVWP